MLVGRPFLFTLVVIFSTILACVQQETKSAYPMTPRQRELVQELVKRNNGWRVATDSDNVDQQNVATLRKEDASFQPFFSTRHKGEPSEGDFAITLVRDSLFTVYYFRWDTKSYLPAQEVTSADWLRSGRIKVRNDTLDVAPLRSDEIFVFVWRPNPRSMEFVPQPGDTK
jgi:hypothetical protein